jgi:hypothetical protein
VALDAGDEILIDNEVGLYRADVLAITDENVAVVEVALQRIFK